jgi:predicted alpha/beta-fold hydrolase
MAAELVLEPCLAPVWARTGHAQTILGHVLPSRALRGGDRFEVKLGDGDTLVGARYAGADDKAICLFHGLSGSAEADYIHRTAAVALKRGYTVYAVNHRGCGAGTGLARHPYHSGRAEDLSAAIAYVRKRHPKGRVAAVGFSLSANALLLLLGGQRGTSAPDYAIAVNAPIDLEICSLSLGKDLNRIYDLRFLIQLRRDLAMKRKRGLIDREYEIPLKLTLRDFDNLYTAPASGFRDREDYYDTCSAMKFVHLIRAPTVVFHADDDPIIPVKAYRQTRFSPSCLVHIEKVGGHMGYLSRRKTPLGTMRWQDYAIDRALGWLERH